MNYDAADGGSIVVLPHAQVHLSAHPDVVGLLAEAIGRITLPRHGAFVEIAVEMGRVVGRSGCVATAPILPADVATFALRMRREKPSRVMVGVEGPASTTVVVIARPLKALGEYALVTSFIGTLPMKEPWDRALRPGSPGARASLDFWCCNALVYDPEVMAPTFESSWNSIMA